MRLRVIEIETWQNSAQVLFSRMNQKMWKLQSRKNLLFLQFEYNLKVLETF